MQRDQWHLQFLGRTLTAREAMDAVYDGCTLGVRRDFIMQTLIPRLHCDDGSNDTGPDWHQQQKQEEAERRRIIVENMPNEDCDGLRGG